MLERTKLNLKESKLRRIFLVCNFSFICYICNQIFSTYTQEVSYTYNIDYHGGKLLLK